MQIPAEIVSVGSKDPQQENDEDSASSSASSSSSSSSSSESDENDHEEQENGDNNELEEPDDDEEADDDESSLGGTDFLDEDAGFLDEDATLSSSRIFLSAGPRGILNRSRSLMYADSVRLLIWSKLLEYFFFRVSSAS